MKLTETRRRNDEILELYRKGHKPAALARKADKSGVWFYELLKKLSPEDRLATVEEHKKNRDFPIA